ncbi:CotH kinase family protein [Brachybacterium huguangmaarense]|uniref:CotH kinase family protein n=1 Tax=Brachybacterium huguangmaarense TaxID=1652028 RepID=A0ABY6G0A0_9MICO|nr:CotH kinase family protein [Brachybacterium huguangmaarense]UYG16626.1 CotH kinase family protein [Brachybacterium huguangmaarense]
MSTDHLCHQSAHRSGPSRRGFLALSGLGLGVALTAAGCSASSSSSTATLDGKTVTGAVDGDFWDRSTLHTVKVVFDTDDYDAMIETYASSQDKTWIEADVEIDGNVFEKVGMKLKGNSSLRSLAGDNGGGPGGNAPGGAATASDGGGDDTTSTTQGTTASNGGGAAGGGAIQGDDEGDGSISADDPTGLPWLIRLDKYTDGQSYSGRSDFVVRGNNTDTSLNEAVALDVLSLAKVPAETYAFTRFSVNGADAKLRLVLDLPDDSAWNADTFDSKGATFKADADGDYSYRGDTADDYADAFDAEFLADGLSEDTAFTALGAFLQFLNESEDADFASELPDKLDVEGFATYLAVQDLVKNTDDIDGPGNNSYLHYDPDSEKWTVVAWDQNLSFGGMGGMGGGGGQGGQGFPGGGTMPSDGGGAMPSGGPMQGGGASDAGGTPPQGAPQPPTGAGDQGAPTGQDDQTDQSTQGGAAQGGPRGGMGGGRGGNILSERFRADSTFSALYDSTLASVKEAVYTSGDATDRLNALVSLLTKDASDLVTDDEIQSDAETISTVITG